MACLASLALDGRHGANERTMKVADSLDAAVDDDDMLPEYDFSKMKNVVRGKYYKQYHEWLRLVRLDEEVGRYFQSEAAVNEALREYIRLHPKATANES